MMRLSSPSNRNPLCQDFFTRLLLGSVRLHALTRCTEKLLGAASLRYAQGHACAHITVAKDAPRLLLQARYRTQSTLG
ncbi:hypothetical protein GUJ93_ZPchr0015g7005 [Zizania palustris]|uniref:Uncharacterized protein n=1 Tax=Zizania palustris TaxID=103762 RepID=A0A8J5W643_ZIZPA|nr:hypothetical protein GUJ93_ZPchr0015g7005 [Zizania palustris]